MGVDDCDDGSLAEVLRSRAPGSRGHSPRDGERIDHDPAGRALDEGDVRDVVAARLPDAGRHLEQAVDGVELRLAPEARVDGVGIRRALLDEVVLADVPAVPHAPSITPVGCCAISPREARSKSAGSMPRSRGRCALGCVQRRPWATSASSQCVRLADDRASRRRALQRCASRAAICSRPASRRSHRYSSRSANRLVGTGTDTAYGESVLVVDRGADGADAEVVLLPVERQTTPAHLAELTQQRAEVGDRVRGEPFEVLPEQLGDRVIVELCQQGLAVCRAVEREAQPDGRDGPEPVAGRHLIDEVRLLVPDRTARSTVSSISAESCAISGWA